MLTEVHAWVHLHASHIWTTLENDRLDHETAMERCTIYLAYLGRGLYVSLHPHKLEIKYIPAQAADTEMDVKPVIIGELTSNESSILDKLIKFGLGIGVDQSKAVEIKEEISSDTEPNKDGTESAPTVNQLYTSNKEKFNLKECRAQVVNLKLDKRDQFKITSESIKALLSPNKAQDADSSSDETIVYWKGELDDTRVNINTKDIPSSFSPETVKQQRKHKIKYSEIKPHKRHVIHSKPSKARGGFKITLHGITRRQPKYYFKCYVFDCSSKFHSLEDWNSHHIEQYKTSLLCLKCPRQFTKPSAFRAH